LPFVISAQALKLMAFSDEQHKELDPRAYRIAKKYEGRLPEWLKKHLDLYILGSMFIAYTAENAKAVMETQVKLDLALVMRAQQAEAARPQGPQPDSDVPKPNGRDVRPVNDLIRQDEEFGENPLP
jgi:hypothetical protein